MATEVPLTWDSLDVFPEKLREPRERIDWPGRRAGGGRVSYSESEELLKKELGMMRARTALLQVAAGHDGFTRTGMLRANARVEHPGVVLVVTDRDGAQLNFATDLYLYWQDNVRAIALGLEGLRRLERYGITRGGKQYTGWKALPPGGYTPPPQRDLTEQEAVDVIARLAHLGDTHTETWRNWPEGIKKTALREAVKNAHPDAGGADADMQDLTEARRVLSV